MVDMNTALAIIEQNSSFVRSDDSNKSYNFSKNGEACFVIENSNTLSRIWVEAKRNNPNLKSLGSVERPYGKQLYGSQAPNGRSGRNRAIDDFFGHGKDLITVPINDQSDLSAFLQYI